MIFFGSSGVLSAFASMESTGTVRAATENDTVIWGVWIPYFEPRKDASCAGSFRTGRRSGARSAAGASAARTETIPKSALAFFNGALSPR